MSRWQYRGQTQEAKDVNHKVSFYSSAKEIMAQSSLRNNHLSAQPWEVIIQNKKQI